MEGKYKLKETMRITQCDNGILMEVTFDSDVLAHDILVFKDEEKLEGVGKYLLEDTKNVMDKNSCNKVRISITIESVED